MGELINEFNYFVVARGYFGRAARAATVARVRVSGRGRFEQRVVEAVLVTLGREQRHRWTLAIFPHSACWLAFSRHQTAALG